MPEQTQQSTPVSAHPVVAIEIRDDQVLVNGEQLENPAAQEPHELAIHHVARSIAGKLGRPVRARAIDTTGTMGLIVHPDGQVSDLEQLTPPAARADGDVVGRDELEEHHGDDLDQQLAQELDQELDERPRQEAGEVGARGSLDELLEPSSGFGAGSADEAWLREALDAAEPPRADAGVPAPANGRSRALFADEAAPRPHVQGHDPKTEWSTSETSPVVAGRRRAQRAHWGSGDAQGPGNEPTGPAPSGPGQRGTEPAVSTVSTVSTVSSALEAPAAATAARTRSVEQIARSHRAEPDAHSFLTRHQIQPSAQRGWRGALTRMGLTTAPSDRERSEREDVHAISRHWPGPRTVAVVNGKGGAGKTPTTVVLSSLFARHGGSGILAWDNNETRGTLGWRTEQGPHEAHVLTMLPYTDRLMEPTARSADLAAFVHHQTEDKYDVLRSNPAMLANEQRLTAGDFDAVHQVASKYFRLIFVDSGNDETAPHWLRMIDHADQVVVATTTRPDHAEAGRLLLDALRERDEHSSQLAEQAVVVVSQADREEASADVIASGYEGRARAALTIPYDQALRAPWLRLNALRPVTQRAYLRAAAAISEGL